VPALRVVVVRLADVVAHAVRTAVEVSPNVAGVVVVAVARGLAKVRLQSLQSELHLSHGWSGRQVGSKPVEHAAHRHCRDIGPGCIPSNCIQLEPVHQRADPVEHTCLQGLSLQWGVR
jgi:hypothetical protein